MLIIIAAIIIAYLIGSVNCAIIICHLMGLPSPRSVGSGNPGATNVLRLGNKKAAGLTLAGDFIKGVLPVAVGHLMHFSPMVLCLIGLAAVLGHIFPLFFKFKGGKGVATLVGVLFALNLLLGLAFILTWLFMAILFRISSLSSLIATLLSPLFGYFILGRDSIIPLTVMAVIVIIRHQTNIKRLLAGTETKIGQKAKV
ncbi:MAG: glycerol-3-phosphate 1-O-acyltransferase PlsY [Gammaproteobacteria bacterium]|nr:glycerol-3-phosphate 1-O-acyltransferase PlsY [Gammaproteobacteria bacterium]